MAEETSGGSIGAARIDVTVNTATMDAGIEAAKHRVSGLGDQAAAEFDKANASTKRYAQSLLRQAEMLNKTRAEQIAYNAQTRIGGDLGDQIAARALANQSKIGAVVGGTGKSVKELQFAMRGLPAQVTDIFTSLASGQRPMMVLLQQGGQLKDMFGGIRPAAAALGSSLLGLVNPFTLAALAVAAVAYAAYSGQKDIDELNAAVIKTGGYAGVSGRALNDMANQVGTSTGKFGASRSAINALAGSGEFSGAGMSGLAKQAVDTAKVTGDSMDKVVDSIAKLNAKPAETIAALNEQYHFLTSAQYAQIAALEEQGRTQDAARLANKLDAEAMANRARDIEDNSNWMVKSAHYVAAEWGKAWAAIKGAVTPAGLAEQASNLQSQIDALSKPHLDRQGNLVQAQAGEQIAALKQQLADVRRQQVQSAFADSERELQAGLNQDAIAAQQRLAKFAAPKDTLDSTLAKANKDRLSALYGVVDPVARAKIEAEYKTQVQAAKVSYAAAVKKLAGPASPEVAAYSTFKGQVAALRIPNVTADNAALTQYQQGVAKLADEMAVYMQKGGDATKAAALFNQGQKELAQTLDRNRQQEIDAEKAYADALDKSNHALAEQVNAQIERIGSGQKEYERTTQITKAYRDQAAALQDLALKRQMGVDGKSGGISQDQYDADVKKLKAATDEKVRILQDGFKRQDAAQADWLNGASMAYHDYVDQAADVAGQTYDLFNNTFTGLSDSLASFVTTGKLDFKSLASSILSDLAKMEARILASKILQGIVGAFLGSSGGNGEMATSFDSNGTFFSPYAKGGVFANSPSLSAYSGQVVSQPTMFAFARGAGVMGEAGPEAIMPLRRGSDGRLGVVASGSGGDMSLSQTFVIDSNGGATGQTAGSGDDNLRKFAGKMKGIAQQAILDEQRPGGSLRRMGQPA